MGDKGEEGVKNLKKWVTLFIDGPFTNFSLVETKESYGGIIEQLHSLNTE